MITKQGPCQCEPLTRRLDIEWNWCHRKYRAHCLECGELAHDGKLPLSEWLSYLFKFFLRAGEGQPAVQGLEKCQTRVTQHRNSGRR